ncbi:hypothetical protein TNCV_4987831 [Trichonephila clavipes]|nr:hypothetical protein TNCV_4987831 [Trichonephila clavipes]
MSYRDSNPDPAAPPVSVTNHYTGWAALIVNGEAFRYASDLRIGRRKSTSNRNIASQKVPIKQGWADFSRVLVKAVTTKCLGGLPVDRDRLNAPSPTLAIEKCTGMPDVY